MARVDSHIAEYKKGEHFIRKGEKDSTIFVLLKGSLAITKDEVLDAELNTLTLGAMLGEVPLITKKFRSTNVIAKKKKDVLSSIKNGYREQKAALRAKPHSRI